MASKTIRIQPATHAKLKELAGAMGKSMPEVLEQAIEALRRAQLLDETNRAYAALRADPQAWRAELAERQAWKVSLSGDR